MRIVRRLGRDRRGIAALEFALVAPILVLLMIGILVWGQFFIAANAVIVAAQQGARQSVGGLTTAERYSLATAAVSKITASYSPFLSSSSFTTSAAPATSNAALYTVTVTYNLASVVPTSLIPVPTSTPSASVTVSISTGGY